MDDQRGERRDAATMTMWTLAMQSAGFLALAAGIWSWVNAVDRNGDASMATRMETSVVFSGRPSSFTFFTRATEDTADIEKLIKKTEATLPLFTR